jgi:hypothetical protein
MGQDALSRELLAVLNPDVRFGVGSRVGVLVDVQCR